MNQIMQSNARGFWRCPAKVTTQALIETAEFMQFDNITLFESVIAHSKFLVRVDILIKKGKSIKIVEVKAKSIQSDDLQIENRGKLNAAFKPYIEDIAFQKFVVALAFPDCSVTSYMMMPDKARVSTINQMNQLFKIKRVGDETEIQVDPKARLITFDESLLYEFNVDHYIDLVHQHGLDFPSGSGSMREMSALWAEAYAEDFALPASIGAQCASCEFKATRDDSLKSGFSECWKEANGWSDRELADPSLLDLWNFRGKQKLMDNGVRRLSEVTQGDIKYAPGASGLSNSARQWMQIDGIPAEFKSAGFYIDHDYMVRETGGWRYPFHFIDFETSTVALPFHRGMKPYESVAFQFSHHVMEQDGSLKHATEFLLAEQGRFPNFEFIRTLKSALDKDSGSVFMWANHENTILTHIQRQLHDRDDAPDDKSDLIGFIETLIKGGSRAMIDLKTVAQKGYFHPSTNGSNSIKKMLPAVLDSSPFLRERYSHPIYGTDNGIPSLNFRDMVWWSQDAKGQVKDPYDALKETDVTGTCLENMDGEDLYIANGGAASMAYCRLQYEALPADVRSSIESKLLRYCELDTLAMAMIVEAWKAAISGRAYCKDC